MNKIKLMIAVIAISVLAGCGAGAQFGAAVTGESEHCVDGVKYIQFLNGASVKYNPDGTIVTC